MNLKIKVCGLRDNISEVVSLKPDFAGFIFYSPSKRYVGDLSPDLLTNIPSEVKKVGVFVNQAVEEVCEKAEKYALDMVQLHGYESVDYCDNLKTRCDVEIIKVFSGNDMPEQEVLSSYAPVIAYYLFDTRGDDFGGSGRKFNWSVLKNMALEKPVFLSGGVGLEDLEAIKKEQPQVFAIDVNSKFELTPGFKNVKLLSKLINSRDEVYS